MLYYGYVCEQGPSQVVGEGEGGGGVGHLRTDRQTDMFVYLESYTIKIHRL